MYFCLLSDDLSSNIKIQCGSIFYLFKKYWIHFQFCKFVRYKNSKNIIFVYMKSVRFTLWPFYDGLTSKCDKNVCCNQSLCVVHLNNSWHSSRKFHCILFIIMKVFTAIFYGRSKSFPKSWLQYVHCAHTGSQFPKRSLLPGCRFQEIRWNLSSLILSPILTLKWLFNHLWLMAMKESLKFIFANISKSSSRLIWKSLKYLVWQYMEHNYGDAPNG